MQAGGQARRNCWIDAGYVSSSPGRQLWSGKSPFPWAGPWASGSHGDEVPHPAQQHETGLSLFVLHSYLGGLGMISIPKWRDVTGHKGLGNTNWTQHHSVHRRSYKLRKIKQKPSALCSAQISVGQWKCHSEQNSFRPTITKLRA